MSASREANPLRKFPRGERRNAARQLAKELKKPFREVWERAMRNPITPSSPVDPSVFQRLGAFTYRWKAAHEWRFEPDKGAVARAIQAHELCLKRDAEREAFEPYFITTSQPAE